MRLLLLALLALPAAAQTPQVDRCEIRIRYTSPEDIAVVMPKDRGVCPKKDAERAVSIALTWILKQP